MDEGFTIKIVSPIHRPVKKIEIKSLIDYLILEA
jgi:hypothetical protein